MPEPTADFLKKAGRILNSGQARALILSGNIHDLFYLSDPKGPGSYVPLIEFLAEKWNLPDWVIVIYELNGPVRFLRDGDREKVRDAWLRWRTGCDANDLAIRRMLEPNKAQAEQEVTTAAFDARLQESIGRPTLALEFIRQLCLCSRSKPQGKPLLKENLLVLIEGADLLLPEGTITQLPDADRHRLHICQDWFSDPGFINGGDSVIFLAESRSLINRRIAQLPQILDVEVPAPDEAARGHFISWFNAQQPEGKKVKFWSTPEELAKFTAGLSIHALMQLLKGSCYEGTPLSYVEVIAKVEDFIQSQLGEEMVEFKKPSHSLKDVIGYNRLKKYLREEFIPRLKATGAGALSGAAVCGPIGGGKTFIFEAVAAESDSVVLVIKNIRSKWFGETDVLFERLRRVLESLTKVIIFLDEADTQLGGVGPEAHETERRLTGKVQAMMSDSKLRGRVVWLLMTARIHLLSPDIRRPGRVGDLIIPVLDPEDPEERREILRWVIKPVLEGEAPSIQALEEITATYSIAALSSMRSELIAKAAGGKLALPKIIELAKDLLAPPLTETRRFQTLQALTNCTRRSLLPDPNVTDEQRKRWAEELRVLELKGIK